MIPKRPNLIGMFEIVGMDELTKETTITSIDKHFFCKKIITLNIFSSVFKE